MWKILSKWVIKKKNEENEKTTHRMRENICKQSNRQGITFQNIQTGHEAQYQKTTTKKTI